MLAWLKNVKGMWVAALAEGRLLGTVNTLYVDGEDKRITGFGVRGKNPLGAEEWWLPAGGVERLGEDLIFIAGAERVQPRDPSGRRAMDWVGKSVSTQEGKHLGVLHDIAIETDDWRVVELALPGGQTVPIDPAHTVFGEDLVLVQAGAENEVAVPDPGKRENILHAVFGEAFVQQASDRVRRILRGSEADLSGGGGAPQAPKSGGERDEPPKTSDPSSEDS